ncbi:MAG: hypothetical protein AAF719_14510 [Pseudomonadota bacterium]
MSVVKRISDHPWLTLAVSAATIVSSVMAVSAFLMSGGLASNSSKDASANTPSAATSDLIGAWVLQSPPDLGWRVRYRADGSFTLTTSEGHVDGFYEAQNGVFTTRAPPVGADDQGAYRLINPTTLEMTGQLGVSVWRREAE